MVIDFWAVHVSGVASASDDADDVAWVAASAWADYNLSGDTLGVIQEAHRHWLAHLGA